MKYAYLKYTEYCCDLDLDVIADIVIKDNIEYIDSRLIYKWLDNVEYYVNKYGFEDYDCLSVSAQRRITAEVENILNTYITNNQNG